MAALFPTEPGLPLQWLPDETLFSLCSRYHKASGNRLASTTCHALFGHPTQGSAHDFPARLDRFIQAAGLALGDAESIVEHHTILPLYLRFATLDLSQRALSAARASSAGALKFQLGLVTSRFRANHPLKACPICMHEDERCFATAYWHREHQLPGMWVCLEHKCMLLESDLKATGVSRFHWILPSDSQFPDRNAASPSPAAIKLAQMVSAVGTKTGMHLRPDLVAQAFRSALGSKGLLRGACGCLRHQAAGSSYADFLKPLLSIEQLGAMPASINSACADIARQIGPKAFSVHPIRRLALAAWLFQDFNQLLAGYTQAPAKQDRRPSDQVKSNPNAAAQIARRSLYLSQLSKGNSTSQAARLTGIDTNTAMAWSASAGIASARRPKFLNADLRASLVAMLRNGTDKRTAAALGNVSLQTVTRLLRTEVGLHEDWKQAIFASMQQKSRRQWLQVTRSAPLSGVKAARTLEPSVYAWLYRNDRDWLLARTREMPKAAPNRREQVSWDARDRELAELVRQAALLLVTNESVKRIKLFQLYQKIPELKAKLSKLDRLPLTREAIYRALSRTDGT